MVIGSSTHYQIGTKFSLSELLARGSYNGLRNDPIGKILFSSSSLRTATRHDDAYNLLLSSGARRTVAQSALDQSQQSSSQSLLEQIEQNNFASTKAEQYGITGEYFDYLKETLPDSDLVKESYQPIPRADLAQTVQKLYERLDEGLSHANVTYSESSGLRLSAGDLPSWLKFDATSGMFFGNPPEDFSGDVDVLLRLTLANGETAEDTFTLKFTRGNPDNRDPYVTGNLQYLADESTGQAIGRAITGQTYRVTIPANFFNEDDPGDQMQIEARIKSDGITQSASAKTSRSIADQESTWPSWLVFHPQLRIFEGVPPASEAGKEYEFILTARDQAGGEVSSSFRMQVFSGEDSDAENVRSLSHQIVDTASPFSYVQNFDDVFRSLDSSYRVTATQKDGSELPSWLKFSVDTIDPPVIDKKIEPQAMVAGGTFVKQIDLDTLLKDEGSDRYEVRATYSQNGNKPQPLPAWLDFTTEGNILRSVKGQTPIVGDYTIHLEIEDIDDGYKVQSSFDFRVNPAGSDRTVPKLEKNIESRFFPQAVLATPKGGTNPNAIALPEDLFGSPPSSGNYQYTLSMKDGSPAPSWLTLDPTGNGSIVKDLAPNSAAGERFELTLTAQHPHTGFADSVDFFIEILPTEIEISQVPLPRVLYAGKAGDTVGIPQGVFSYEKPENLEYTAVQSNGSILPSWVQFDAESQSFRLDEAALNAMVNKPYGDYTFSVTARDQAAGKQAKIDIPISLRSVVDIQDKPVALSGEVNARMRNDGSSQVFSFGEGLFSENIAGEAYSYDLQSRDGSPLPSWLTFDASQLTLTGNPPNGTAEQDFNFVLTAKDPRGEAARVDVRLSLMSRDTSVRLKLYGDPKGQQVGSYDILLTAGKGEGKAMSEVTLNLVKGGGNPTFVPTTKNALPPIVVDQNQELYQKLRVSEHFDSDLYNSKYSVRQENGAPLPSWLTFNISRDQVPLIKQTMPDVGLVRSDTMEFAQSARASFYVSDESVDTLSVRASLASGAPLPGWLSFNENEQMLSISDPKSVAVGSYTVRYTYRDETDGHEVHLDQVIRIHPEGTELTPPNTPDAFGTSLSLSTSVGSEVSLNTEKMFGIPSSKDSFVYRLTMRDGSAIPSWLNFDPSRPEKLTASGTPPIESSEDLHLVLRVTNSQGIEKRASITLTAFKEGDFFSHNERSVAVYTGEDADDFSMSSYIHHAALPKKFADMNFTASLVGGGNLPPWMVFDAEKGTLAFNKDDIPAGTQGLFEVEFSLSDGASLSDSFVLDVNVHDQNMKKDGPEVLYGMAKRSLQVGVPSSFALPRDTFTPPQAGESYKIDIIQANGDPLPSWLQFDSVTQSFSGTPPLDSSLLKPLQLLVVAKDVRGEEAFARTQILFTDRPEDPHFVFQGTPEREDDVGVHNFELSVVDVYGSRATSTFTVDVRNQILTPNVDVALAPKKLAQREVWQADLRKHFSDPEVEASAPHSLTYSLEMQDGSPVPSWITIDKQEHTLRARIPDGASGDYQLRLKVKNAGGGSIDHDFLLEVGSHTAPRFVQEIGVLSMFGGESHFIEMNETQIINSLGNSDGLVYHFESTKDKQVPSWVEMKGDSLRISPPEGVTGLHQFVMVATDTQGAQVRQEATVFVSMPATPSLEFSSGDVFLKSGEEFSFRVPPYAFSVPEGEKVEYGIAKSPGMTTFDTNAFKALSELVWDEIMRETKYDEDFSHLPEEGALRITGYLKAMDVLAGGNGDLETFQHIRKELPYLDLALFDQELFSMRDKLPLDRVHMTTDQAIELADRALDLSQVMNRPESEQTIAEAASIQKRMDTLLDIDMERILKSREIDYTPIENSTARAREALTFLVQHIFEPALRVGGNESGSEFDLGLTQHTRNQANAVFRMLTRNMNFGADTPTVDSIAAVDKQMIAGLMRTLDYLTGGDGKNFDLAHIIELLPKEHAQYGERYLKELSDLFEVESISVSGEPKSAFANVARLSAEYDAYLSLDSRTQSLHTERMRELQYQIEVTFNIRNSPTSQLMFASRAVDYGLLFADQATGPASLLSASLSSLDADVVNQNWLNKLYGSSDSNFFQR